MADFRDDMKDMIVNDASISANYDTRIYFQLFPGQINKDKKWLRWGFAQVSKEDCMGGGTAYTSYSVFMDIVCKNVNDLPALGDEIIQNFHSSYYNGITNIEFQNESYSNYEERDLYQRTLNFIANHK